MAPPPPPPPPDDEDDDDTFGSPTEKCGFVCHLITVLLAILYTIVWCSFLFGHDDRAATVPVWMSTLPATAVCLFYAAPLMYGVLNTTLVAHATNTCCVEDVHSRSAPREQHTQQDDDGGIIEIYDLDVGDVNDTVWAAMLQQQQRNGGQWEPLKAE